jgi:hypothetical protein
MWYCFTTQKFSWRRIMDIELLQEFFFEAANATYVGGGVKKTSIVDLPGAKVIKYQSGEFHYVDLWYVGQESEHSFGQTTIWHNEIPIWGMQFGGYYPEDVIEFLKDALRAAYSVKAFHGGRGLPTFTDNQKFTYTNHTEINEFTSFAGQECIYRYLQSELVGRHWYRGYYLE